MAAKPSKHSKNNNVEEIAVLAKFDYALAYFSRKNLTERHLKLLLAIERMRLEHPAGEFPSKSKIAAYVKQREPEIRQEIEDLVQIRLLHVNIPIFGDINNCSYKLGAQGGSFMKKILDR